MSGYCKCSVTLPHDAVGLSVVSDSDHTHLLFGAHYKDSQSKLGK